jgi:hypothetical protein
MNIQTATRKYEKWLTRFTPLVQADLEYKHQQMAAAVFPFLRATFYRWVQIWPAVCKESAQTPRVLSVGDLHVENFGTWRDREGRLVWGVNDFDEACHLPYTNDLVRLATSAQLAIEANHLSLKDADAFGALLRGYTEGLKAGGRAFVLSENHVWLRNIAHSALRDPVRYWQNLDRLPELKESIPESAVIALEHVLPQPGMPYQVKRRVAGLGSLGHPRYVAVAEWEGGKIAREAKALVPSSATWTGASDSVAEIFYQAIVDRAVRCRDPFVQLEGHWIVRRLAPDCSRIELASLPEVREEAKLLYAMGWETANIHLGSQKAVKGVQQDLKKRPAGWLRRAANEMARATQADWEAWKSGPSRSKAQSSEGHMRP